MTDKGLKAWIIYVLQDPGLGKFRYVGVTSLDIRERCKYHIKESKRGKSKKCKWLKELLAGGEFPEIAVLETGYGAEWKEAERFWIAFFREVSGDLLVNSNPGGTGCSFTDEMKAKISAAHKGRKKTAEHVEKIAAAQRGKPKSETARRNKYLATFGDPGWYAWYKNSRPKGWLHSEETKRKISKAKSGKIPKEKDKAKRLASRLATLDANPVLTNDQISSIFSRIQLGEQLKPIAIDFGVSECTAGRIKRKCYRRTSEAVYMKYIKTGEENGL